MDSLFANYASSDEEEEEEEKDSKPSIPSKPSSISIGLPPPRSSSLSIPPPKPSSISIGLPPPRSSSLSIPPPKPSFFSSLPPPKSLQENIPIDSGFKTHDRIEEIEDKKAKERKPTKGFPSFTHSKPRSSIFSSLPPPKSQLQNPIRTATLDPNPKRVVQFTLPFNPSLLKSRDLDGEDEEDEEKERKPSKDSSSSTSSKALSSMLPAPKNSLCLAPAPSSAASRRSVVEAQVPASNPESFAEEQERSDFENYGSYGGEQGVSGYDNYGSYGDNWAGGSVEAGANGSLDSGFASNGEACGLVQSYGSGEDYGSYVGNWSDGSVAMAALEVPEMGRIMGKRGRNEIPTEIMEVKQDELIKNRPREDQVKLTGIAFGPSYQAVSSSKGKPTKLHKRKHQIGSLYFDMKQKEMELAERRSKGFLTKAETQAKYGW